MGKVNTIRKVIKIANSSGITLDKKITDYMKIKPGDYLEVSFKQIKKGGTNGKV